MNWNEIVERITPYMVKIETPDGYGTGFLCLYNDNRNLCGIATAYHVVRDAEYWRQPIRITHHYSTASLFLTESERIIYYDARNDSAVILIQRGELEFPETVIPLLPTNTVLDVGSDVGWLGFPAIASETLCFFSGNISAWWESTHTYLIDGVAISGVSGGPVLCMTQAQLQIVGTMSAYRAGGVGGAPTPGLAFAQDVSYFHDVVGRVRSLDEANREREEAEHPQLPEQPSETPDGTDNQ